ncbi:hypothetical protein PG991_012593 [Apiospora marii]|uniref:Uncharacterized protein n=1 Tax=Apiospora marii TaxID=335849 RepID=A0ABR1RB26_9PEZI
MEQSSSQPGSPGTAPLQLMSPDRVNQQTSPSRSSHHRDSSIHDKIQQFNSMSQQMSSAAFSKQLERKTADAALKRAMLGREEAESEMRRYRDEARGLRKYVEEGRERERKVGERLETVMENYGRAKETYAHTQALWEKEIRKARKETFKSQSNIVKLQEELKSTKAAAKSAEEVLQRERERSQAREQEAFEARYQIVGVQEQLEQALERIKVVEQERDAFKTLAKNEEVARIAAEGRLPLPSPTEAEDEFSSPKKARSSLSAVDIVSSATSEAEIDDLTRLWQWEKQRADRTQDHLEFLQTECQLRCCPCASKSSRSSFRGSVTSSARKPRPEPMPIVDAADFVILGQKPKDQERLPTPTEDSTVIHKVDDDEPAEFHAYETHEEPERPEEPERLERPEKPTKPRASKEPRRSTIFVPSEGIFRTLSQHEIEEMEAAKEGTAEPPAPKESTRDPVYFSRTPSVEPPAFALLGQERKERTSLLSLLNAPRQSDPHSRAMNIPTTPGYAPDSSHEESQQPKFEQSAGSSSDHVNLPEQKRFAEQKRSSEQKRASQQKRTLEQKRTSEHKRTSDNARLPEMRRSRENARSVEHAQAESRLRASATRHTTTTTTTSVPLREGDKNPREYMNSAMNSREPSRERAPSFDRHNPALTPTMTREEALAQIRERRGRARSAAQGAVTPHKQQVSGVGDRRDVSAPAGRAIKGRS